jgi:hypothetical protein
MASAYLYKTLGTPTSTKKYTFSTWVKRAMESTEEVLISAGTSGSNGDFLVFRSTDQLEWQMYHGTNTGILKTDRLFRDPAAWYHIVIAYDSANVTAGDRMKMYVNGVEETSFATDTNPPQDTVSYINSAVQNNIGYDTYGLATSAYFGGVLAHTQLCDGQAYAASDFGETDSTSGIWVAKTSPSVTYGNNGFFLKYQDTASFGDDSSGNTNDFTMSGTITQTKDTPDDNFCTINPLSAGAINGAGTPLTNGNTRIADGDTNWRTALGTIVDDQGKYYWEVKIDGSQTNWWLGILDARQVVKGEYKLTTKSRGYGVTSNGDKGNNNSEVSWATATIAQNDIVSIAVDMDNGKIYFGHNGTWLESGDPTSGSTGTGSAYDITTGCCYLPAFTVYDTNSILAANMGNGYFGTTAVSSAGTNASGIGTFEYDVPTGYTAVSTLGLME